ncbi:hypothetical protein P3S68_031382 [Capsicum galapagoense]
MISIEIQSKTCVDCGTTRTPLWRIGPAGPKSLCNACGIRSRKKRRALLELNKENKKIKKSSASENKNNQNPSSNNCTSNNGDSTNNTNVKKKLSLQRSRSNSTHWKKLGEVEKAAFLLMSLSCGSVFV